MQINWNFAPYNIKVKRPNWCKKKGKNKASFFFNHLHSLSDYFKGFGVNIEISKLVFQLLTNWFMKI